MKKTIALITLITIHIIGPNAQAGNVQIWQEKIEQTNINVRGNPSVLHQLDLSINQSGKILVELEGYTTTSVGDLIVLAASDNNNWASNDGNISVKAYNNDENRSTVAHSRGYEVTAGNHSYFAIAENFIDTAGTGNISFYGSLTVKFYPTPTNNDDPFIIVNGVSQTNIQTEGSTQILTQIDMFAPVSGSVLVHFNGHGYADIGDRQLLAASNSPNWSVNNGHVPIEAFDNDIRNQSFFHSQLYEVNSGNHSFYAVGNNFVETTGNGLLSVYGALTVEFMPHSNQQIKAIQTPIIEADKDLDNGIAVFAEMTSFEKVRGQSLLRYNGFILADVGDRVVSAATNNYAWSSNSRQISTEVANSDQNNSSISHAMLYPINKHQNDFQAVGQVFIETQGNGLVSSYANLTVQVIQDPDSIYFSTFEHYE